MEQPQPAAQGGGTVVFQRLVQAVGKVVYGASTRGPLLQMIQAAGDPVQGVAQAALTVVGQLGEQMKGSNPRAAYAAAPVAALMLLEVAEAASLVKFDKALLPQVVEAMQAIAQKREGGGQAAPAAQEPEAPAEPAPAEPPAEVPAQPVPAEV